MKFALWALLVVTVFIAVGGYTVNAQLVSETDSEINARSKQYQGTKFSNAAEVNVQSVEKTLTILKRYITEESIDQTPKFGIPVETVTKELLDDLSQDTVHIIKLGHSTVLLKVMGEYWLIDPIFADRASPFTFLGPKRFHDAPIEPVDLPNIERILISHNHYDHLDESSIRALAGKTASFLVPLGVKGDLVKWGIAPNKVQEFDWWQEIETEQALVAFTPTQHFSGRAIGDSNHTLWGSWVIKTPQTSLYFSGDSGYFDGFKEIGDKYGPFDLTLLETGAYDQAWKDIHMLPEESVQAHIDLRGKVMVPIHNGTFDLSFHTWYEPLDRVVMEAEQQGVLISTPVFGVPFQATDGPIVNNWWSKH
ncbi:MBL fold metallo-hydrolase [Marinomonas sp. 2405UD68-3]|uniref:MBL fold metallo-hydrolase n=1 Tax=Marinomonas sp. 2405UD68-3 TaxID=3391835 RepID=UPI0039C9B991